MDTQKSNEDENDSFEIIEPEKDTHEKREFEIDSLATMRFRKMKAKR